MNFNSIRSLPPGGPYEGIPVWLVDPLDRWIDETTEEMKGGYRLGRRELVGRFDMLTKAAKPMAASVTSRLMSYELHDRHDVDLTLDFVNYLLMVVSEHKAYIRMVQLMNMLDEAGSIWTITSRDDTLALSRRVPDGVQDAANAAMNVPGDAGSLLREAWSAAFGRGPDYEKAYSKSVKAVEAAAVPLVSPKNAKATLGSVIGDIRNQRNWGLGMTRDVEAPSHQLVLDLAQRLWTGQNDRHAGQPGYRPSTKEDAEAAVMIAVTLVQWFASGALVPRP